MVCLVMRCIRSILRSRHDPLLHNLINPRPHPAAYLLGLLDQPQAGAVEEAQISVGGGLEVQNHDLDHSLGFRV